tara:strand:- start:368 stop:748 length:381 start_codon:yes stop_codon:yes gene_type:complete
MKTKLYHDSFEYQSEYDSEKLGTTGISVSSKKEVCYTCDGNGEHFRKDLDENAMVNSLREDGDDDGYAAYRNGAFNQVCTECNGENVVDKVDWNTIPSWAKDCISEWETDKMFEEQVRFAENGYHY